MSKKRKRRTKKRGRTESKSHVSSSGGGVLTGMRRSFRGVLGVERSRKTSKTRELIVTITLLVIAGALILQRCVG